MCPSKRSSFAQASSRIESSTFTDRLGSLTIRASSAAKPLSRSPSPSSRVVQEVLLELVEDDEQRPAPLRPRAAASRRASRAGAGERLVAGELLQRGARAPPRSAGTGSSRHERNDADGERAAPPCAAPRLLAQAVDDAGLQQRALADAARAVQDRQPRRAQVGGDDRRLRRAPEEEVRVVLAVGHEPDVRAVGARGARRPARRAMLIRLRGAGSGSRASSSLHVLAQLAVDELDVRRASSQSACSISRTFGSAGSRCTAHDLTTSLRAPQIRLRITRRFQSRSE